MAIKIAGKIIIRPMGEYDPNTIYRVLDMVTLNNNLYVAKKDNMQGVKPVMNDTTNWLLLIDGSRDVTALEAAINAKIEETNRTINSEINKVIAKLDDYATTVSVITTLENYYNKTEVDSKLDGYYPKATVDSKVKAINDKLVAELAKYMLGEDVEAALALRYTKTEVDSKLNGYYNKSQVDTKITDLQGQIDGNISTFFYEVAPTLTNAPASGWTTNAIKNTHLGDLYYNTANGYCYRFMVQNGTYSWTRVKDSDITKALSDASSALSKANAATATVETLQSKLDSLTFSVNVDTGNLEWRTD